MKDKEKKHRERLSEIIEVGNDYDFFSRGYDFLAAAAIFCNLGANILYTFERMRADCGWLLLTIEYITAVFFALDYLLHLWTADCRYPDLSRPRSLLRYVTSFTGLVDLFSFLPYFIPVLPAGAVAFRLIRIIRIFRLFRINRYYDSLMVIWDVIYSKRQQLISSVTIILILMIAASLCMYSLEHDAQPDKFKNALSGIWWAASTLLTVGYGDIVPITTAGKIFGIVITFLGVGMVAIPTGIISAGFVDQYSRVKKMAEYGAEEDLSIIKVRLTASDSWVGKSIGSIALPQHLIIAVVKRGREVLEPKQTLELKEGDLVLIGAESFDEKEVIQLKEIDIAKNNPWVNLKIRDLDISRQTMIVMVRRGNRVQVPQGDFIIREGDKVILYTQKHMAGVTNIEV